MEAVTKIHLPNGLSIHLKEIHTAPIISHWVWYRVGSRDETPGITGASHWVEHMQFKGTPTFPPTVLDKAISREGGAWNAFTYLDWTTYFETLPADKIDLALSLEADRMFNSLFDPTEVDSERKVILSEREGNENDPLFRLGEAIQEAAFLISPYRHEIVGYVEDLERMGREELFLHYRTYYQPANAVIAIAGDFQTADILARLEHLYLNSSPAQPVQKIPRTALVEPLSTGEKRVEVSGPGETTFLQVSYHAPAASNPDFFALAVLDSLLSGPTSLNMFGGGGISNKTSRLYRALIENELAVSAHGSLQATIDPYLYDINLTLHPDRQPEELLSALDDQIKRLQDERVSEAEIARATKQARALFAYGSENITNQAFWLGYAEMFASYEWFTTYVESLEQVTPEDIQRIAQTYLQTSNRVNGIYLPTGEEEEGSDEPD